MAAAMNFYPSSLLKRYGSPSVPIFKCSTAENTTTRIEWVPDAALFEKRAAAFSSHSGERSKQLPKDWPYQLTSPLVWSGNELKDEEYIYTLSYEDVQEIECALHAVKGQVKSFVIHVGTTEQLQTLCWISTISVKRTFACLT